MADCNETAWQAVQHPEQWLVPVLLIIGEAASGKTHLAELFHVRHDADKIEKPEDIQQVLQNSKPRVFDNVDRFMMNYPDSREDVFHLVNASMTDKVPLFLTAQRPPQEWVGLPDLLSRLQAANHIHIEEPNEDMIKQAYHKFFTDRGILVDNRVLDYLTTRSERSFAGIRRNVDLLDKASLEQSRKVTIPLIQSINLFE